MIGLNVLFWIFVVLFGIIGLMRGWAKEILVSFSVILGLFIISVIEKYGGFLTNLLNGPGSGLFWMRFIILTALVFFGYQGPNIPKLAQSNRFVRERLQDSLLGLFLGALNGYLIFGTIWSFMESSGYPFPNIIASPVGTSFEQAAVTLIKILPPMWLGIPGIYIAVALAFAFVLVVFI